MEEIRDKPTPLTLEVGTSFVFKTRDGVLISSVYGEIGTTMLVPLVSDTDHYIESAEAKFYLQFSIGFASYDYNVSISKSVYVPRYDG